MQSRVYLAQGDLALPDGIEVCRLEFLVGGFYEIPSDTGETSKAT